MTRQQTQQNEKITDEALQQTHSTVILGKNNNTKATLQVTKQNPKQTIKPSTRQNNKAEQRLKQKKPSKQLKWKPRLADSF